MKKLLILALFVLLTLPAAAAPSAAIPDSCEYKILLKADNFVSVKKGCELFWELVNKVADDHGFSAEKAVKSSPNREICFLDTPTFDLYKKGFVLRLRASNKAGELRRAGPQRAAEELTDDPEELTNDTELTLKFRASDLESTIIAPVEPAKKYGNDVSSEVDVVVKAATPVSVFSRSGTITGLDLAPDSVKKLLKYYPRLAIADLDREQSLKTVNNLFVIEQRILHGSIDFGRKKTKTIFSIWYVKGSTKPLIAEFSFKINMEPSEKRSSQQQTSIDNFFVDLVRRGKLFISPNQTKTGIIYQSSRR
ncbi:MAG: hypothetical protein KKB51_05345 [Candidatus Riflebacteria bacterium]|nr:hypothetical protein [Candidatus Riflebacteria bacterium]